MTAPLDATAPLDQHELALRDPLSLEGLDRVIAAYAADVDVTILIENLRLTPQQRFDKFVRFMRFIDAARGAARGAAPVAADDLTAMDGSTETPGNS